MYKTLPSKKFYTSKVVKESKPFFRNDHKHRTLGLEGLVGLNRKKKIHPNVTNLLVEFVRLVRRKLTFWECVVIP